MSCRTTPAGSAWTTFARLESGLTDVQTLSAFHALRREGRGVPAPSESEWAAFVEAHRTQMQDAGFSEARLRSLGNRMDRAAADLPDGATWFALRNIRERARAEAAGVEQRLRELADQAGEDYEAVAGRYHRYLDEVPRGRSVRAPEGYTDARDQWRTRGLPADHGTYQALTRLAEEARVASAAADRPRRIVPVEFPNSRAIASAGYDPHDGRLEVTFRRRDREGNTTGFSRTYAYRGVPPRVWAAMCSDEGPGTVYNREIRNHDEYRYPTREEEDAAAHRRCADCGQWWGPGHTCPQAATETPAAATPTEPAAAPAPTTAPSGGSGSGSASGAAPRRRGLVMVDQNGRVHLPEESHDYAARVRAYEAQGLTTSDAQSRVEAEDLLAERAATRAAADAAVSEAAHTEAVADLRARLTETPTTETAPTPAASATEAAPTEDADVASRQCEGCGQYLGADHTCPTPAPEPAPEPEPELTFEEQVQARMLAARTVEETDAIYRELNTLDLRQNHRRDWNRLYSAYSNRRNLIRLGFIAPGPDPQPDPEGRPEPRTCAAAGVSTGRYRNPNANSGYGHPGRWDTATFPNLTQVRSAAAHGPVIVPVTYEGNYRPEESSDGLPAGRFRVRGDVTLDRPGRGQWNVANRSLQCNCPQYQETYSCPHIDYALGQYRQVLTPTRSTSSGTATVDPAAAQAAAEAAMRQDWMRSEEHAAEARARHAAASDPTDSYTNNFAAFEADHNAALQRKARGEEPVPFMTTNALNGQFTRESGRGFGVEMEFDFPPSMDYHARQEALRQIGRELYEAGLTPVDYQQGYHASASRGYTDNHERGWSFEQDCTVSGEIVSPVMYDEPETWANIEKVCEIVRRNGGIANAKTGSHVHVGAPNMTTQTATELMQMTNQHEDIMYRLSQNPDRSSHRPMRWCGPNRDVPQGGYTEMYQVSSISSHANNLNFGGVRGGESDHPEIRHWDGTLNPAVIQAQVKVSAGLVQAAERNASLGQSRRNREPVGSHHTRLQAVRGRSRRALTSEELEADTATARSFVDTLFTRREDKAQVAALFAVTKWQRSR